MNNGTAGNYLSAGTVPYAFTEMIYSIGFNVLKTQMKAAARFLVEGTKSLMGCKMEWQKDRIADNRGADIRTAVAFVQGSSLDILIEKFGLEVDPEDLRETFFTMVDYWKRKK